MPSPRKVFLLIAGLASGLCCGAPLRADTPAPAPAPTPRPSFIYTFRTGDKLRVELFGEELTQETRVDASGNINLPLVQDVHIGGMTVAEAQKAVEVAYHDGRYLRDPHATVSVEEYSHREVSIQGQVKNPSRYVLPVDAPFTVVDLVTKAGGFTDIAQGNNVTITHHLPDGREVVVHVDVASMIKGKGTHRSDDPSIQLQPDDIVFVPERLI